MIPGGAASVRAIVFALLCAIAVTVLEFKAVDTTERSRVGVMNVQGILSGRPFVKTYQSRVLGPRIVGKFSRVSGRSLEWSLQVFCIAVLLLTNVTAIFLFVRESGSWETGALYTGAYALLFAGLQQPNWLPVWDYLDLLIMLVFAWAVVTRAPLRVLIPLFLIELLNRETALFIPLWIIIDSLNVSRARGRAAFRIDAVWNLLAGVGLIAGGVAWTHFARNWHFVKATFAMPPQVQIVGDQTWMLALTPYIIAMADRADVIAMTAIVIWSVFLIVRGWRSENEQRRKESLLLAALVLANFMFGRITETRIWFAVSPFLLWMTFVGLPRAASPDEHRAAIP